MELFEEQGFEKTSAVQIAQRARVTTRTFFRYFPDKEEVLLADADADAVKETLVQHLLQKPDVTDTLQAVTRTLADFDWEKLGPRQILRQRDAMIASDPRLLERELIKQQQLTDALRDVLCRRGTAPDIAELAANTGSQVFRTAYRKWLEDNNDGDLTTITENVMSLLAAIMARGPVPATAARLP
ncbi:TetR family transcriptional regulator [Streptomyces aurantiacus]|uniref:TetR family transcriptional regulator n=2 Tax=Streptomyces aurantiacus TaxID=47760 RepID=A0A7G1NWX7_9ACTN|nr:TetR family transcriptional regulator [Streptomyces aurantiacus]